MSIYYYTYKDDIVLDIFGGSFTTCITAQKLGRRSLGFELRKDLFRTSILENLDKNECKYKELN